MFGGKVVLGTTARVVLLACDSMSLSRCSSRTSSAWTESRNSASFRDVTLNLPDWCCIDFRSSSVASMSSFSDRP